jgi:hypothetical protein
MAVLVAIDPLAARVFSNVEASLLNNGCEMLPFKKESPRRTS